MKLFNQPEINQMYDMIAAMIRRILATLPISILIGGVITIITLLVIHKIAKKELSLRTRISVVLLGINVIEIIQIALLDRPIGTRRGLVAVPFGLQGGTQLIVIFSVANVLLFIPIGILLPLAIKKLNSAKRVIFVGFAFSICIEVTQYILGCGMTQVEDVIMNTLGVGIGYLICWLVFQDIQKG